VVAETVESKFAGSVGELRDRERMEINLGVGKSGDTLGYEMVAAADGRRGAREHTAGGDRR